MWREAEPSVNKTQGVLVIDDSTLDKPYAQKIDLVTRHWSGKHKRVVCGINLITLMWTDGDSHIPCDYRLYNKDHDGLTKNDHFHALIATANKRGFQPACVVFDSWYSSLKNLKTIQKYQWHWLTQLKSNRQVNLNRQGNQPVNQLPISNKGTIVHLKGYGLIKVFKIVSKNGNIEYWATSDLSMNELFRLKYAELSCVLLKNIIAVSSNLLALKGVLLARRWHNGTISVMALRAFLRMERQRFLTGIGWFEAKLSIIRDAVRAYLDRRSCGTLTA